MHADSSSAKTSESSSQSHAGAAEDWTSKKERGCLVGLKIMVWIATTFGRRFSRSLLYPVIAYYLLTAPDAVASSRLYLSRVLGRTPRRRDIFRHLYTFAAVVLDRVYFLLGHAEKFDVRVLSDHYMEHDIPAREKGVFLMGAHMGSFEVVRMVSRQCDELKLVLLMFEENARKISALMTAINPAAQQEIVPLGNLSAMLTVKDRLAEGALVGILADRSIGSEKTATLPFLGAPAPFAMGPFRMAAMMRRPVFLMMGVYLGGNRYDIHIERIADFSDAADGSCRNSEEQVMAAMQAYVARLEHFARQSPYNWFNFYDFWQGNA
ncbi:acyl-CoA synthetase [uncultured Oxalicibacterium sp.]|uniref:LpxL/LpxP family acyltransferase n=1 Tax=uncultured Oxalicibacterium sp. TaxID=1168540 RepID=UPI0025F4F90F|nr:acyl-CoA synthetase [uncultured Oxalicibacterium sp.]